MRGVALVACVSLLLTASAGCFIKSYRVEVRDRATGEPVTAVVEVAHVDSSDPPRELHWTREVWIGSTDPAAISLSTFSRYRMVLFVRPDVSKRIPDRDQWTVLARWPRPLRPDKDANSWHASDDERFDLRLARNP